MSKLPPLMPPIPAAVELSQDPPEPLFLASDRVEMFKASRSSSIYVLLAVLSN